MDIPPNLEWYLPSSHDMNDLSLSRTLAQSRLWKARATLYMGRKYENLVEWHVLYLQSLARVATLALVCAQEQMHPLFDDAFDQERSGQTHCISHSVESPTLASLLRHTYLYVSTGLPSMRHFQISATALLLVSPGITYETVDSMNFHPANVCLQCTFALYVCWQWTTAHRRKGRHPASVPTNVSSRADESYFRLGTHRTGVQRHSGAFWLHSSPHHSWQSPVHPSKLESEHSSAWPAHQLQSGLWNREICECGLPHCPGSLAHKAAPGQLTRRFGWVWSLASFVCHVGMSLSSPAVLSCYGTVFVLVCANVVLSKCYDLCSSAMCALCERPTRIACSFLNANTSHLKTTHQTSALRPREANTAGHCLVNSLRRCEALTAKGRQCMNSACGEEGRCHRHRN
jgi:hypothetical protein